MAQNKVFVNINSAAVQYNLKTFRALLAPKAKLFAVVNSNAYGHGLTALARLADKFGADGFCVDSVI